MRILHDVSAAVAGAMLGAAVQPHEVALAAGGGGIGAYLLAKLVAGASSWFVRQEEVQRATLAALDRIERKIGSRDSAGPPVE